MNIPGSAGIELFSTRPPSKEATERRIASRSPRSPAGARFWLDVHAGNLPAIRLYRAAGLRVRSMTAGAGGDLTYLRMSLELDDA